MVFSLAVGIALIGAPGKATLLPALQAVEGVLLRIAGTVARAAPIGVFALIAHAAGTMSVEALGRVQVYFLLYIATALLLSLWVLPGLIAVLTPLRARRVLAHSQDALVTAFATGSLLIVIPLMEERRSGTAGRDRTPQPSDRGCMNLMVPINSIAPDFSEKLFCLVFLLFAGWVSGNVVPVEPVPPLPAAAGWSDFFAEVVVALPFFCSTSCALPPTTCSCSCGSIT